jgi:hypothetical protein
MQTLANFSDGSTAFESAAGQFEDARRTGQRLQERFYALADRIIRLRIVGEALAEELFAPFDHLRIEAAEPFLTIDVWHEAETGVRLERGDLPPKLGPYGIVAASTDGLVVAEHRPHSAALLSRRERRILAWVSRADRLHLDERARPFHKTLAVSLGELHVQLVHAGLVASEDRGGLFVGAGGSGKSTSTICCFLEGLTYLGDDFVGLVSGPGNVFVGYSLYSSALIKPTHMRRYPALLNACRPGRYPDEEKSVVCFGHSVEGYMASKVDLGAIILPRIVPRTETSFRSASARDALLALAPSSLLFLPGGGTRAMDLIGDVVTRVPAFWLELGTDVQRIAPQVRSLLAQA